MGKPKILLTSDDITDEDRAIASSHLSQVKLDQDESVIWNRVAPLLQANGLLSDLYIDTLVEYCRVVNQINEIHLWLKENGLTYKSETRNGTQYKAHPQVGQLNELRRILRSYVSDFGLSPAAKKMLESQIQLELPGLEEDDNPYLKTEKIYKQAKFTH
jgi:P27 family predicted phage terminase small subunit